MVAETPESAEIALSQFGSSHVIGRKAPEARDISAKL